MIKRIPPVSPREPRPDDARFRPAAIALRDGEPAMPGRWLLHAVFLLLAVLLAWAVGALADAVQIGRRSHTEKCILIHVPISRSACSIRSASISSDACSCCSKSGA